MGFYDFIVVGAGSAGCVVAARLVGAGHKVLLLEAGGPDRKMEIAIPGAFYKLYKTEVDWAYFTTPQEGLKGRRLFMPRGKTLGGSSSINAMIYIRGHREDYNAWARAGNRGWDYNSVLPYFRKSEDFLDTPDEFHGNDGPLTVSRPANPHEMAEAIVQAGIECGYQRNNDFSGNHLSGFGLYHLTVRNGKRCSSATAFLKPLLDHPNLDVKTDALVTAIQVEDGRATSVRWTQGGKSHTSSAKAEIVLCGGAINSPQLLMLSGIGPADELREMDISIVKNLPGVGKNLQDHLFTPVVARNKQNISLDNADNITHIVQNMFRFFVLDSGPLTSNLAEAGGFIRTEEDLVAPDMQYHFAPAFFVDHGFVRPKGHGISLCPTLLQPESRGELTLRSTDPDDYPDIDPQHLSKERDLETLKKGARTAMRMMKSMAMKPYLGKLYEPTRSWASESELEDWIRGQAEALYHPVGTCKMGNDKAAVVDDRLRVRGIRGLRVADASIMPVIVRGNTNAPSIMIGEKAADMILEDIAKKRSATADSAIRVN